MAIKRSKPIIQPIVLSPDKQKMLHDYLKLEKDHKTNKYYRVISSNTRRRHIMDIVGKLCSYCDGIPSYILTVKLDGISRVERYCQSCYDKIENRERDCEQSKSYLELDAEVINDINLKDKVRELLNNL